MTSPEAWAIRYYRLNETVIAALDFVHGAIVATEKVPVKICRR